MEMEPVMPQPEGELPRLPSFTEPSDMPTELHLHPIMQRFDTWSIRVRNEDAEQEIADTSGAAAAISGPGISEMDQCDEEQEESAEFEEGEYVVSDTGTEPEQPTTPRRAGADDSQEAPKRKRSRPSPETEEEEEEGEYVVSEMSEENEEMPSPPPSPGPLGGDGQNTPPPSPPSPPMADNRSPTPPPPTSSESGEDGSDEESTSEDDLAWVNHGGVNDEDDET
mgnify:FL=1